MFGTKCVWIAIFIVVPQFTYQNDGIFSMSVLLVCFPFSSSYYVESEAFALQHFVTFRSVQILNWFFDLIKICFKESSYLKWFGSEPITIFHEMLWNCQNSLIFRMKLRNGATVARFLEKEGKKNGSVSKSRKTKVVQKAKGSFSNKRLKRSIFIWKHENVATAERYYIEFSKSSLPLYF